MDTQAFELFKDTLCRMDSNIVSLCAKTDGLTQGLSDVKTDVALKISKMDSDLEVVKQTHKTQRDAMKWAFRTCVAAIPTAALAWLGFKQ